MNECIEMNRNKTGTEEKLALARPYMPQKSFLIILMNDFILAGADTRPLLIST
jgi:hypothetical protein